MPKTIMLKGDLLPDRLDSAIPKPKQLNIIGPLDKLLQSPCVAVVGSRKVTPYGKAVTLKLTEELVRVGVVIISGMALGIDAIAHKAALQSKGKTIAVLPTGLDNYYPKTNYQLAEDIISSGGALVSEYSEGEPIMKHNFIARNRIIAALSDAVLITEAAQRSGSLHTARFALEQGKNVMAIPGNINNFSSVGTNNLIKSGAIPVTDVSDIMLALGINSLHQKRELIANSEQERLIMELLNAGINDGDTLLSSCELEPAIFNQTLSMMEITGTIRPLGNNQWTLV